MTTRSNFACETPLIDRDDAVKLLRFLALALAVSIVAIWLQVAFVALRPSTLAPELSEGGSGASLAIREVTR